MSILVMERTSDMYVNTLRNLVTLFSLRPYKKTHWGEVVTYEWGKPSDTNYSMLSVDGDGRYTLEIVRDDAGIRVKGLCDYYQLSSLYVTPEFHEGGTTDVLRLWANIRTNLHRATALQRKG